MSSHFILLKRMKWSFKGSFYLLLLKKRPLLYNFSRHRTPFVPKKTSTIKKTFLFFFCFFVFCIASTKMWFLFLYEKLMPGSQDHNDYIMIAISLFYLYIFKKWNNMHTHIQRIGLYIFQDVRQELFFFYFFFLAQKELIFPVSAPELG